MLLNDEGNYFLINLETSFPFVKRIEPGVDIIICRQIQILFHH